MLVLGLADNHDAGAALVRDGELVAACGQERIDRKKNSGAFPWGAIDAVLDMVGARYRDVDRVVFGTAYTPSWLLRRFPGFHHEKKGGGNFDYLLNLYIAYQVALRKSGLAVHEHEACRRLLAKRLSDRGFRKAQVTLADHHMAHAQAAYRCQGRERCLVLTVDAMGDGVSSTVCVGRHGQLNRHWEQSGFAAVNTYYSRVTEFLGFTPNRHEGKITGLAAYAEPPPELLEHFRSQLHFDGRRFSRVNYLRRQHPGDRFYSVLSRYSREEVAAALQQNLELALTAFVAHWVDHAGIGDLAVCGGIFANVKLNQRICELPGVSSLFVFPNMGDGGLCIGAAMACAGVAPHALPTVYLGPSYTDAQIGRELSIAKLKPSRPGDLADAVVDRLVEGKVVARFAGGMEFGPRALGHRTLLVRPDSEDVNTWLNDRLQRSEFMPFAPVVLDVDAPRLFHGYDKARHAARFMTVCFDVHPELAEKAPGCVHIDGTARPQVIREEDDPEYYAILQGFKARTGIPALINTSFNMHEEPIVCSPHDAIRAWKLGRLDSLAIGPYLVDS
ncbi:MAG TPA: carbamoyltransferase C-terminal domain-containing protein [Myxococcota bacterium]|nr:carbamoyltransferase C-terminal domain-containing protein [Myxococcota bacterium]